MKNFILASLLILSGTVFAESPYQVRPRMEIHAEYLRMGDPHTKSRLLLSTARPEDRSQIGQILDLATYRILERKAQTIKLATFIEKTSEGRQLFEDALNVAEIDKEDIAEVTIVGRIGVETSSLEEFEQGPALDINNMSFSGASIQIKMKSGETKTIRINFSHNSEENSAENIMKRTIEGLLNDKGWNEGLEAFSMLNDDSRKEQNFVRPTYLENFHGSRRYSTGVARE